ncbi:Bacterial SH3 domain protein [Rhodobacteraceae bacterium THAF1]|uniref:SH3 domain-containing protein n=1 Tax=Palleronia sp. THAF1 TaxID=2587842 RepID=UPI000F3C620B|nr:SH3 domain-containing protein [Palleronia sp. THAF1]QFU09576.1 Bacterial SH3 domain protein [Palleronia sp. THAF1]VDC17523.1 Bacterial SH3 domain protein [Rhodobacteraceae bacterium THAF1]
MIRLTLLLVAGLVVTFSIAGQDPNIEQGSDAGMDVSRAQNDLVDPGKLALDDEAGAIERAIAATDTYEPEQVTEMVQEASLIQPAKASETSALAVINATRVNLRAGPSTANAVLDQATRNQQVQIVERTADGWARIQVLDTGTTAWIYDRFLTPQG